MLKMTVFLKNLVLSVIHSSSELSQITRLVETRLAVKKLSRSITAFARYHENNFEIKFSNFLFEKSSTFNYPIQSKIFQGLANRQAQQIVKEFLKSKAPSPSPTPYPKNMLKITVFSKNLVLFVIQSSPKLARVQPIARPRR